MYTLAPKAFSKKNASPSFPAASGGRERGGGDADGVSFVASQPKYPPACDGDSETTTKHPLTSLQRLCRRGTLVRQSMIDGQECPSCVFGFCTETRERVLSPEKQRYEALFGAKGILLFSDEDGLLASS